MPASWSGYDEVLPGGEGFGAPDFPNDGWDLLQYFARNAVYTFFWCPKNSGELRCILCWQRGSLFFCCHPWWTVFEQAAECLKLGDGCLLSATERVRPWGFSGEQVFASQGWFFLVQRFLMHRDSFQGLLDSHYSHLTVSRLVTSCCNVILLFKGCIYPESFWHENASPSFRQWHVQCWCLCFGKSLLHNVNKTPIQSAAFGCWIGPNFGEIRADPVF